MKQFGVRRGHWRDLACGQGQCGKIGRTTKGCSKPGKIDK